MPVVGKKHYPYSPAGYKAANKARRSKAKKAVKGKK
jgi:hypothetical protein